MRVSEDRSIEGSVESLVTKVSRTWEGVEVVFGDIYTVTVGRAEWANLRDRIDSTVNSGAPL